jgi:hypothetical protein
MLTPLALLAVCASAATVHLPVTGTLTDAGGAPLEGASSVTFKLYSGGTGGSPWHEEELVLLFTGGAFSAALSIDDALALAQPTSWLSVSRAGAESPRVQVGSVLYALRASRADSAAEAEHAGDADHADAADVAGYLGALAPEDVVTWADGYLPGDGLELTGRTLSIDPDALAAPSWGEILDVPADLADGDDDTTYVAATASVAGLMSAADKAKLDGLSPGGTLQVVSSRPASPSAGALIFNTGNLSLELYDGTKWRSFRPVSDGTFSLAVDGTTTNALGAETFTSTPVTVWDATNKASGSHALSALVYYNSPGDWGLATTAPSSTWNLNPSDGDFEFEWDYRQTNDNNWGLVHFSSTTAWADTTNTYVRIDQGESLPPDGWMIGTAWQNTYMFFSTPAGKVYWTGLGGYSTAWKRYKLRRVGATMELFQNGVSLGTRTAPAISDTAARTLYIFGSPNGGSSNPANNATNAYSTLSQMDNIQFRRP